MKKLLLILALGLCTLTGVYAQKFDPKNPNIEQLSSEELAVWVKKDIAAWKTAYGSNVESWNPLVMEFYKQIRIKALGNSDLQTWMNKSDEDWQKAYGSMDAWKIEDMLFYSAIQDLKNQ